jgi:hypothetical protein
MRSIFVRVEPTVRLVRVGEGVENTDTLGPTLPQPDRVRHLHDYLL